MRYRPQHDEIDPDYPAQDILEEPVEDANAPNDAYVIGEHGNTVQNPTSEAKSEDAKKPKAWVMPAAFILSALFVGLTVWNVSRALSGPPPPPKPSPFQVKQALYLGVMRVDAYRRVHGVTPATLLDVGLSDTAGYSYQRIDSTRYTLSFRVDGPQLEYDSNEAKERFFGEPHQILSLGGSE